jgi:hypothetical protein
MLIPNRNSRTLEVKIIQDEDDGDEEQEEVYEEEESNSGEN